MARTQTLVELCAEFDALERQVQHVVNVRHRNDDAAGEAAAAPLEDQRDAIAERILATTPATAADHAALARSIAVYDVDVFRRGAAGGCLNDRLLAHLLRGFVAGAPGAFPDDSALLADCAAFDEAEHQYDAICGDGTEQDAERDRITDLQDPIVDRIVEARATTPEAHRARAQSLIAWNPSLVGEGSGDTGQRLLHALLRDLVGLEA